MPQTGERPSGPDKAALSTETPQAQVAAKAGSGYSINLSTTDQGFAIQYTTPSGRDPNKEWDWIAVYERSDVPPWGELGNYKTWNWVCPNKSCGTQGTAIIDKVYWERGKTYTLVYLAWKWNVVATATITP